MLKNLSGVLTAAGTDKDHAVKTTIYRKNISDFAAVNEAYGKYFKGIRGQEFEDCLRIFDSPRA